MTRPRDQNKEWVPSSEESSNALPGSRVDGGMNTELAPRSKLSGLVEMLAAGGTKAVEGSLCGLLEALLDVSVY